MDINQIDVDCKVIIIIGLPGSGKTTISNKFTDYLIFDDFLNKFYDGKVLEAMQLNKKICLIDPRLCIYEIFNKYMDIIKTNINKNDIHLILFRNEPEKCIANVTIRNDDRNGIIETINKYSVKYSLDNYADYSSHITILHVWTLISNQPE